MEHSSQLRNLFQYTISQLAQPQKQLTLKENQVVMGHVLKLFPDQKALIQVGHSKVVAQLEISINALEKYWFIVKGSEQQGLTLKIVKQVEGATTSQLAAAKDLLGLFQQRPSKQNVLLTNELMKENIPITQEQLIAATDILKNTPKLEISQTVQAIISTLKQNYPLSDVVVRSIIEAQTNVPLAKQIDQLLQTLQQENFQTQTMKQLIESITKLTQKPSEYHANKLIEAINNPNFIQTLSKDDQTLINQMMTRLELKKDHTSTQIMNTIKELMNDRQPPLTPQVVSIELSKPLKGQNLQKNETSNQFVFNEKEIALLRKLTSDVPLFTSKDDVRNVLFATEKKLGLIDEVKLWHRLNSEGENMKEFLSLKNMLVAASKEAPTAILREQIDQIVHRLNGQSLLQQDNGPIQQIITQIPLFMKNHQSDLTIQWNGKKQADGTIDPAFCRILFYLQLPSLNETMIDVQIQNRVMNITIRNNSEALVELVALKRNELKEALNKINYHVSSVKVKSFETSIETNGKSIKQSNVSQLTSSYTGVDIKI